MGDGTILGINANVMFILLLVLVIISAVITVTVSIRLKRLVRRYRHFMRGSDGKSLEEVFKEKFSQLSRIAAQNETNKEELTVLKKQVSTMFSHYGFVKYDAFDDVGGKMSFALALLDDSDSGFILNTIHSRDNCFQYIKEIVNGESYIMLSKEETEALRNAIQSKEAEML